MSVSTLMVRVLVSAVEQAGVSREQLLATVQLDASRLDDRDGRVSFADYARLQQAALELSADEALGLHLGERVSAGAFDVLGHLTEHASTLRQSVEAITRYSRIFSALPGGLLHEEGAVASIRFAFLHGSSTAARLPAELAMSGLLRLLRAFAGPMARAKRVCFEYEAPTYRAEYTRVFEGSERFLQPFTGIEFERTWLDRSQLYQNPELYGVLKSQAERALGRVERSASLQQRIYDHLESCGPTHMPAMEDVARKFDMSARSLRRRLAADGTNFKSLVERALASTAKRLLEEPHASIQETAYAMGFATPAAFHRAFKRWTGLTPKVYKTSY